jgi:hypothetical protein
MFTIRFYKIKKRQHTMGQLPADKQPEFFFSLFSPGPLFESFLAAALPPAANNWAAPHPFCHRTIPPWELEDPWVSFASIFDNFALVLPTTTCGHDC